MSEAEDELISVNAMKVYGAVEVWLHSFFQVDVVSGQHHAPSTLPSAEDLTGCHSEGHCLPPLCALSLAPAGNDTQDRSVRNPDTVLAELHCIILVTA